MVRKKLDKRAVKYINEVLGFESILSVFLRKKLNLTEGNISVFLPSELSDEQLYNFTRGGIFSSDSEPIATGRGDGTYLFKKKSMIPELSDFIFETLSKNKRYWCVLDDVMMAPGDNDLEGLKESFNEVEQEIYHIVNQINLDNTLLLKIINAVNVSWHFLCVVVELSEYQNMNNDRVLSEKVFLSFLDEVRMVIIGAYDGEGFIVWEK